MSQLTYGKRAELYINPAAKDLLNVMERKKSNLCVSVDVTSKESLLKIIDTVGPYVCLIKVRRYILLFVYLLQNACGFLRRMPTY